MKSLTQSFISSVAMPPSAYAQMKTNGVSADPMQVNAAAEALIRARSIRMIQQIFSQTVNPANTPVIYVQPAPVGLVLGFFVEIKATLADPGGAGANTYALTPLGPSNALSQIVFNDLSNVTRIQTAGWHLHMISSAKGGIPWMAARTNTAYPVGFGNNMGGNLAANQGNNIIQASSVYSSAQFAQGVQMLYWVPLAYSQNDLRGTYYANVVNANAQLQLTINPSNQAFVGPTDDPTLAVYQNTAGAETGAWGTEFTVTVYQVYYDQLPVAQNGAVILPNLSMSVIYDIKNAPFPGIVANQDFPIPYSNFRDFMSTCVIFANPTDGVYPAKGSDVNYWAHKQANTINIFKYTAKYPDVFARQIIGDDFPLGLYYFDSRVKPISTVQFGNQQLVLNAASVAANAQCLVGFEAFAYLNTIVGAQSLSSGT